MVNGIVYRTKLNIKRITTGTAHNAASIHPKDKYAFLILFFIAFIIFGELLFTPQSCAPLDT